MRGHFDFGDDSYISAGGMIKNVANILLGVVSAGGDGIAFVGVFVSVFVPVLPCFTYTPCGHRGQQRVTINLQTPSGTIGEVELESVEPVSYTHLKGETVSQRQD